MAIIMLINLKGGVAKTTNAVALAECLAATGKRTLLIDADHQCMAGELLLGEMGQMRSENRQATLYDLLAALLSEEFAIHQFAAFTQPMSNTSEGSLTVLPCSIRIEDFSTNMAKARKGYHDTQQFQRLLNRRKALMRKWLDEAFDFTIIDCPPSMALQVRFLMSVADCYIVPCVPDRLSVRGSLYLMDRIHQSRYKIKPLGTLWSMYRVQSPLHRRIIEETAAGRAPYNCLPAPFHTIIPNATKVAESAEYTQLGEDFRQKYSAPVAKLYQSLCDEINARLKDYS